jgi:hypothetical protein
LFGGRDGQRLLHPVIWRGQHLFICFGCREPEIPLTGFGCTSVPRLANGSTARRGMRFHHTVLSSDTSSYPAPRAANVVRRLAAVGRENVSGISPPWSC